MKKLAGFALLGGLLCLAAAPALADIDVGQAQITRVGGFFYGSGGEFTIGDSAALTNAAYASTVPMKGLGLSGSFQTFCLEHGEEVRVPQTVYVRISTTAIDEATGLVTGPGTHADRGGKPNGDNLDPRTAYLYTKFAKGELAGYDYSAAGREASSRDLQRAIWFIEEEVGGANNSFVQLANAAVAQGGEWEGRGIGRVRVLNLFGNSSYTTRLQDQIYLSVPAPGAAMLGTLGLVGIVALRRRMS